MKNIGRSTKADRKSEETRTNLRHEQNRKWSSA